MEIEVNAAEERQVPLGRIIAEGADAVIEFEIEREVQALDHKTVEERAKYFQERLQLNWKQCTDFQSVQRVLEIRNQLLHENPGMTVTDSQLEKQFRLRSHCHFTVVASA